MVWVLVWSEFDPLIYFCAIIYSLWEMEWGLGTNWNSFGAQAILFDYTKNIHLLQAILFDYTKNIHLLVSKLPSFRVWLLSDAFVQFLNFILPHYCNFLLVIFWISFPSFGLHSLPSFLNVQMQVVFILQWVSLAIF